MEPWGGVNLTGGQLVTMTTPSGMAIYYTLDGSYPGLANGTLYSGPFTITGTQILTARAYNPSTGQWAEDLAVGNYRNYGFQAGDQWYTSNDFGNPVAAMGGGVTYANGRYYLVGEYFAGGINQNIPYASDVGGIWLYSSPDFYNWTFESVILNPSLAADSRPHILFNASTNQWVLWDMCASTTEGGNGPDYACIATSPAITGPWAWTKLSYTVDGHGFHDNNLFQDDDGTAYVTYTDGSQANIYISQLTADYLSVSGPSVIACGCPGQEAPVLFKRNGTYFLIHGSQNLTTYTTDINPLYQTASSPLGPWSGAASLFAADPIGTNFNGQPETIFKIQGTTDGWVYLADLWRAPITTSTHVLLPLSFSDSQHVQALTPAVWDFTTLH